MWCDNFRTFDEFVNYCARSYESSKGEKKLNRVIFEIQSSNKISGLIETCRLRQHVPTVADILSMLPYIPYFLMSLPKTQVMGGLIALKKWNDEVNRRQFLISDADLLVKAKRMCQQYQVIF